MEDYDVTTYGERIADVYDQWYGEAEFLETDAAVTTLARLAGGGPVLELAIGTGRIALPLAEQGLEVCGIDASEAMVARLREKPGGDRIPVTMGDFADVGVARRPQGAAQRIPARRSHAGGGSGSTRCVFAVRTRPSST